MTSILWGVATVLVLCFGAVAFFGAPYVPSRRRDVEKAFTELYPLSKKDVVVDIGSGDGKVLRLASRHDARAVGYELNPLLVWLSNMVSWRDPRVRVYCRNFWHVSLPQDTTLVYTFLETRDMRKMERYLEAAARQQKRPLYFMSYGFQLPGHVPHKRTANMFVYKFVPSGVQQ